ncbi:MAG: hypothetical protein ACXWJ4_11995 [Methyloceanibacter sp.]
MRLLLGMILGALLTVGAAFISDSMTPSTSAGDTESRRMVNRDVAGERLHAFTAYVREEWDRLTR